MIIFYLILLLIPYVAKHGFIGWQITILDTPENVGKISRDYFGLNVIGDVKKNFLGSKTLFLLLPNDNKTPKTEEAWVELKRSDNSNGLHFFLNRYVAI